MAKKNAEAAQGFVNTLLQYTVTREQKLESMNKSWDNAMLKIIADSVNVSNLREPHAVLGNEQPRCVHQRENPANSSQPIKTLPSFITSTNSAPTL